jgi:hypothetical protein
MVGAGAGLLGAGVTVVVTVGVGLAVVVTVGVGLAVVVTVGVGLAVGAVGVGLAVGVGGSAVAAANSKLLAPDRLNPLTVSAVNFNASVPCGAV